MSLAKKPIKILIAGGGTGGHLFPGMAIAEEFSEKRNCIIHFVGTKRGIEAKVIPQTPYHLHTIPVSGLYRVGIKKKILTLLKLPVAFLKSLLILLSFRPHLVIGIGGYASGPILVLSILFGRRTVLQEQNAFPGMTNRLLGKYVKLAFIPFSQSQHLFRNPIVVGNPIRKAISQSIEKTTTESSDRLTIAIVGGSQGAHILNRTLVGSLPQLNQLSQNLHIIHQTGKTDYQWVLSEYSKYSNLSSKIEEFIDDMAALYGQSHLLICRAGSMINEIIAMGKASVLIPIAVSSGNHQRENARTMADAGAAMMIEEKELNAGLLFETIQGLIKNRDSISVMGKNAKRLYKGNSAQKIVTSILDNFQL